MTRQQRLWLLRGSGLTGGVLILVGTLIHVFAIAYCGGAMMIGVYFVARQWLRDKK